MKIVIYIRLKTVKVERKGFSYTLRKRSDVKQVKEKIKNIVKKYFGINNQFITMYARVFYDNKTETDMIGRLTNIEDVDKAIEQLEPYTSMLRE